MKRRPLEAWALAVSILETACIMPAEKVGELASESSDMTESSDMSESSDTGDVPSTEDSGGSAGMPASACGPDGPSCLEDQDLDCVGLGEDNAPDVYNPDQSDLDGDGFADPIDGCALLASPMNTADADGDGLGNDCDPCRRAAYGGSVTVTGYMQIRNVPSIDDADGDGIGDACDNCIHVPNCEGYGPAAPWHPGDPIADGDPTLCQADADDDLVGDACQGVPPLPGAAGMVGLGVDDDFDQDGLTNIVDACPRAPLVDAIPCAIDADCPATRSCEPTMGLCDHDDTDGDGVGDVCDTCPSAPNPLQVADGGQQLDDPDGDFRGDACESGECSTRVDPTRTGFYPVSVGGWCCTTAYPGDDVLFDPDGIPLRVECSAGEEAALQCRPIPAAVTVMPGMVSLPVGCSEALAEAGLTNETHLPLTPADVGGLEGLWPYACRLQPLDQDFDGLGDACDSCRFAFDPEGQPYIDDDGMLWPNEGKYCNGDYHGVCMGG